MIVEKASGVAKYIIFGLIIVFIIIMLVFTGGSSRPFYQVAEPLANRLALSGLEAEDDMGFRQAFGYQMSDFSGVLFYTAPFRFSAEEVLLIQVHSSSQVNEVRRSIETRLEQRRGDFGDYAPEQTFLLDNATIIIRGTFIFVAVSDDAGDYARLFLDSL